MSAAEPATIAAAGQHGDRQAVQPLMNEELRRQLALNLIDQRADCAR